MENDEKIRENNMTYSQYCSNRNRERGVMNGLNRKNRKRKQKCKRSRKRSQKRSQKRKCSRKRKCKRNRKCKQKRKHNHVFKISLNLDMFGHAGMKGKKRER